MVTWNVATAEPPEDVTSLLQLDVQPPTDLYVIGWEKASWESEKCITIRWKCWVIFPSLDCVCSLAGVAVRQPAGGECRPCEVHLWPVSGGHLEPCLHGHTGTQRLRQGETRRGGGCSSINGPDVYPNMSNHVLRACMVSLWCCANTVKYC